jgi:hypothetical protein
MKSRLDYSLRLSAASASLLDACILNYLCGLKTARVLMPAQQSELRGTPLLRMYS